MLRKITAVKKDQHEPRANKKANYSQAEENSVELIL